MNGRTLGKSHHHHHHPHHHHPRHLFFFFFLNARGLRVDIKIMLTRASTMFIHTARLRPTVCVGDSMALLDY